MYQAADSGVREAILSAMRGVIKHAGKSIGPAVRIRIFDLLKDLMHHEDDHVRISATSMLGVLSQVGFLTCIANFVFLVFMVYTTYSILFKTVLMRYYYAASLLFSSLLW